MPAASSPPSVLSIDVEDWFHVENLKRAIPRETWDRQPLRVERNVDRLLELLDRAGGVRATWFVLGWVAERCPVVVGRIAAAGHEIACHGYGHELLPSLSAAAFRADVQRSKALLEDLVGESVRGYRAPSFSITEWALPVLQDLGFLYDSSVFAAVTHDRYGRIPSIRAGDTVVEVAPGFYEIGVSCVTIGSMGLPWGGGGYFRAMPYAVFRLGVRRITGAQRPFVFYLHPWEIDPAQPRVHGVPLAHRLRHYVGLGRCEARFVALLQELRWGTMSDLLGWARDRDRFGAELVS
jgi:polysaccharide deacetylase family protein (PEP-CTERM system associated)